MEAGAGCLGTERRQREEAFPQGTTPPQGAGAGLSVAQGLLFTFHSFSKHLSTRPAQPCWWPCPKPASKKCPADIFTPCNWQQELYIYIYIHTHRHTHIFLGGCGAFSTCDRSVTWPDIWHHDLILYRNCFLWMLSFTISGMLFLNRQQKSN